MFFAKKRTILLFLTLILILSFATLAVSCSNKYSEPYDEFRLSLSLDYRLSEELTKKVDGATQFVSSRFISIPDKPMCKLYDAKALKSDEIVYVSDDFDSSENAVITTKWLYYSALLANTIKETPDYLNRTDNSSVPILKVDDLFALYRMITDDYCIEKINMMPLMLRSDAKYGIGEDVVPYGVPIGYHLPHSFTDIIKKEPACNSNYYGTVTVAAFSRYKMIDLNSMEKKPTKVSTYGDNSKTLTIIGYIETEADKLLSTGVSMDENSEEYKTVIAQLSNPVFYSLNGTPLK